MSQTRSGWLIIGLVGALLLLGLALGQLGYLGPVRNLSRALLVPFQTGLTSVGTDASDLVRSARDLRNLRQRNAQLQAETQRHVDVNHYDPVLGTILGDNGHRRPANVSSANAKYVCQRTSSLSRICYPSVL